MYFLASFIMRGRLHAYVAAVIGNAVPFISPATVGLVSLRKGVLEGSLVCLWGLLPLIVAYYYGGSDNFLSLLSAVNLLNVLFVTYILSFRGDWGITLFYLVFSSFILMSGILLLFKGDFSSLVIRISEAFKSASQSGNILIEAPSERTISALMLWTLALNTFLGVIIARWWQALLYNPGGFGEEFQGLKIKKIPAVIIVLSFLVLSVLFSDYSLWAQLILFPMLISGIALLHWIVRNRNLGKGVLFVSYFALVFFTPFVAAVFVFLGTLDCFVNLRDKLSYQS